MARRPTAQDEPILTEDQLTKEQPALNAGFFVPEENQEPSALDAAPSIDQQMPLPLGQEMGTEPLPLEGGALAEMPTDLLTDEEDSALAEMDGPQMQPGQGFDENLAEYLDDDYLDRLAQRIIDWVDEDKQAREPWQQREARAMRMLGITEETEGGADFPGASRAVHPLLTLGCVQFQSRSISEIWPAGGPAKTIVLGHADEEREKQAKRVGAFLNYQYTRLMPGAFEEKDRLLMRLPMSGSCFMRVYYDPLEETVVSRMADAQKVYVPYAATDLASCPRFTYEFEETHPQTLEKQEAGYYLDAELIAPHDAGQDNGPVDIAIDEAEGATSISTYEEEDALYTRYETACFLSLPDEVYEGENLPYLVTIDKDNQKVLRIQRNWRPSDQKRRRRVHLIHYYFVPGFGFYGYGFTHLIGGLQSAATGALRALLDSAYLSNMQGGFVTRDARMGRGKLEVKMGQWNEVDVDAETLNKAFFPFPYKEPSDALTKLLEIIEELGNSVQTTTENVVGESNNNAPVGTTLALIEQGLKVFSAIHKRLHEAQTRELRLVAELNAEYLPQEYPYLIEGEEQSVFAADFDDRVDVMPVSDPNVVTNTQRIAQAQSVRQMAMEAPDLYDRRAVERWMLETLRVPDIDAKLPDQNMIPRRDPVSESEAAIRNEPIQVYPDQDHAAHIAVHTVALMALTPELQETVAPALQAHIAEHQAQFYRAQMAAQMGIELPQPGEEIDPQMEMQLAQMAAQIPQITLASAQAPGPDPAMAKVETDRMKTEAEIQRKDTESAHKMQIAEQQNMQAQQQAEIAAADEIAEGLLEEARARSAMLKQDFGAESQAPKGLAAL